MFDETGGAEGELLWNVRFPGWKGPRKPPDPVLSQLSVTSESNGRLSENF